MSFMRFSAAPAGRLSDRTIPWALFGERPEIADGLEDSALAGVNLAQIGSVPGAPMFEPDSLFGAHIAGLHMELAEDAPVVVFVHGFEGEPRRPVAARCKSDNPHRTIFHFDETLGGTGSREEREHHRTPWFARGMLEKGRGKAQKCEGLAVGYSYASYGGSQDAYLPRWSQRALSATGLRMPWSEPPDPYINAYRDAEMAGYGLAAVLTQLRARLQDEGFEGRRIDILCHSLGARTVMSALAMIAQRWPENDTIACIDRVLLLGGACYWGQAAFALANITFANPPSRPQFYNFNSGHDDVLRYLAARATPAAAVEEALEDLSLEGDARSALEGGRTIGMHGRPSHDLYEFFGPEYTDWVDVPLDGARTRRWGQRYGFDLRGRRKMSLGDHWVHYTHPGNWALYRAILHEREGWSVPEVDMELNGI
ncbi:MAG: hypothetical protein AB8B85_20745 [Paracoccaceae bacterium]